MNYIKHQLDVLSRMDQIKEFKAYHLTLYLALFRLWNRNRFKNPIYAFREELMEMARIGSKTTYFKIMKDLHNHDFVKYEPSHDPEKASKVHLTTEWSGTCPRVDHEMVNILKDTNNTLSIREPNFYDNQKPEEMNTEEQKRTINELNNNHNPQQDLFDFEEMPLPEEIIPQKEKRTRFVSPPLEHIQIYFQEKNHSKTEAERFFNYYESNGWLVGGKTKMKDWKAAARNWMLNIQKFETKSTIPERNALSLSKRSQNNKPKPPGHKPSTNYDKPL